MTYHSGEGIAVIVIVFLLCVIATIFYYLWLKAKRRIRDIKEHKDGLFKDPPPK